MSETEEKFICLSIFMLVKLKLTCDIEKYLKLENF